MGKLREATGGGSEKKDRYVRLRHWMMLTEAWRDLRPGPRAAYIELASRYNGGNNGSIPYSLDEFKKALHIGKTTAGRFLEVLEDHGFVVCTKRGHFDRKIRHASEWLLTEHPDDRGSGSPIASKDFARWTKSKTGPVAEPAGSRDGTERVLS